jgi:hypothetical protein
MWKVLNRQNSLKTTQSKEKNNIEPQHIFALRPIRLYNMLNFFVSTFQIQILEIFVLSLCLPVSLSLCLSVSLSLCLSVSLSLCLSVSLSLCLSVSLSLCLSVSLSLCLFVSLSLCLSVFVFIWLYSMLWVSYWHCQ